MLYEPAFFDFFFIHLQIDIYEETKRETHSYTLPDVTERNCSHVFKVAFGAIYSVRVSTNEVDAMFTASQTFHAPPILAPYEVKSFLERNGSCVVYWQERNVSEIGGYVYEVLVSPGNKLNVSTAMKFTTKDHTFIYTNSTDNMYTFAVRVRSDLGYYSGASESVTCLHLGEEAEAEIVPMTGSSLTAILVVSFLIVLVLCGALAVFVMKHRKLQNSFTRFANSHYDTRSGAATFDDHGLEDEDSPQITGFSDDEPLVIA